jgi:hypothetical protein
MGAKIASVDCPRLWPQPWTTAKRITCPATEAGHDRRNRDMSCTGAAQVTIPAITTGRAAAPGPEPVIVRIGT